MSGYASGGYVGNPLEAAVMLDDDECVIRPSDMRCVRSDVRHHREVSEVRTWSGGKVADIAGLCRHRACAVEPVRSVVDGEIVARLCRACDAQLPA